MNEPITQSNPLAEVVQQFEQWRITRAKHGRVPAELRALVPPLKAHYNISQITRALKISHTQLQKYLQLSDGSITSAATASFVECQARAVLSTIPTQGITLSFNCKNGQSVTVSGLHGGDMVGVLSALMGVPL
jgi:hypothetical protein